MEIRIPLSLARKKSPTPNEEFGGDGNKCHFFCFAAVKQAAIKSTKRVVAADGAERSHVTEAA